MKPTVKIENWMLINREREGKVIYILSGIAQGHYILGDGFIYTSRVLNINLDNHTAETLNTIYNLGEYAL